MAMSSMKSATFPLVNRIGLRALEANRTRVYDDRYSEQKNCKKMRTCDNCSIVGQ
jgi:hypothetical protein